MKVIILLAALFMIGCKEGESLGIEMADFPEEIVDDFEKVYVEGNECVEIVEGHVWVMADPRDGAVLAFANNTGSSLSNHPGCYNQFGFLGFRTRINRGECGVKASYLFGGYEICARLNDELDGSGVWASFKQIEEPAI